MDDNDELIQNCGNCYFYREDDDKTCRRHSPMPYDFLKFYELEIFRDIALTLRGCQHNIDLPVDQFDDVTIEAVEAFQFATWPTVDAGEWCGDWKYGGIKKTA